MIWFGQKENKKIFSILFIDKRCSVTKPEIWKWFIFSKNLLNFMKAQNNNSNSKSWGEIYSSQEYEILNKIYQII